MIKLSNMLPAIALGKERTFSLPSVQAEFLMGGGGGGGGNANNVEGGVGGGAGRIVRQQHVKRMSGKGGATRSNATTN
jgi:hypothetical protein